MNETATFMECWPVALTSLSLPGVDVPLSLQEAAAIGRAMSRYGRRFQRIDGADYLLNGVLLRLDAAVHRFPEGAFIRLGSRSPKDSPFVQEIRGRVFGGRLALMCLTEGSRRIAEDLEWALAHSYSPHIFARPWIDVASRLEIRCFVRDGLLVGASQYSGVDRKQSFPQLQAHAEALWGRLQEFFQQVIAVSHLSECAFDVVLGRANDTILLDLAPFGPQTDTLLFEPRAEDFDRSFRYLDRLGQVVRLR